MKRIMLRKSAAIIMVLIITILCIMEGFINPIKVYAYTTQFQVERGSSGFTVVLMSDGTVKSFGLNTNGQLGIGNTTNQFFPVAIPGLTNVKQISVGTYHTLALMSDGTVKAWGIGNSGQLGIGNTANQTSPVTIPGLTGVSQVVAGGQQSFALMNDGTVKAWGNNNVGYLGIGNTTNQASPVTIPGLTGVKQLCAGSEFTLALMNDGTVKAWGSDSDGQLGDGGIASKYSPTTVPGLSGVSQLVVGGNSTFAIMNDKTIKVWGGNSNGQLGIGSTSTTRTPTALNLADVKQLVSGSTSAFALMNNGTVKAWGYNLSGDLGIENTTNQLSPVSISRLSNVNKLLASGFALMNDGAVYVWGNNNYGQLGIGDFSTQKSPVAMPLIDIKQISAGSSHVTAHMNDGTLKAWGNTSMSQTLAADDRLLPVTLNGFSSVKQVVGGSSYAGGDWTLVLMNDGTVKGWGDNAYGQLGIGNTTNQGSPVTISGLTGVNQLVAGSTFVFAIMSDGTAKAWGNNGMGQLGIGSTTLTKSPITVTALTNVKQISAGANCAFAIMNDGTVKVWGGNSNGELGIGNTTNQTSPVTVSALTGAKQIAGGLGFSVALMSDGTVKAWGSNSYGQLGIGNTTAQYSPVTVSGLSGVQQVSSGVSAYHVLALMGDGTVKAWGYNNYGQIGIGNATNQSSPVTVPGLTGVNQLIASKYSSFALMNDGTLYSWGHGLLIGRGLHTYACIPILNPNFVFVTDTTPPEITINPYTTTPTNQDITVTASTNEGSLNATSHVFTSNGSFDFVATDEAGNTTVVTITITNIDKISPSVPGNLISTDDTDTTIDLLWDNATDNIGVTGYKIYRDGIEIGTTTTTEYLDTNLSPSTMYTYTVKAYDTSGNISDESATLEITTSPAPDVQPPLAPENLIYLNITDSTVDLMWENADLDAVGYKIYRNGVEIGTSTSTDYTDTNLSPSTSYVYSVTAYDAAENESERSNEINITTNEAIDDEAPSAPTNLKSVGTTETTVHMDWVNSVDNIGVTGYIIFRDGIEIGTSNINEFTDTGLLPGLTYLYYVKALDAAGNISEPSNSIYTTTVYGEYISTSYDHSLYLKSDGTLWSVGKNWYGQLGDGTTTNSTSWKQVLTGVSQISTGTGHSLALKSDGTLWAIGSNGSGQLGDGTTTNTSSWKQVLTGVSQISAGRSHSMALKTDGTLWITGYNYYGNLGTGTNTNSSIWKQVLTGVTQISGGGDHSLALKADSTLWATGANTDGQLGDNSTNSTSLVWKQVLSGVSQIEAGHNHSLALKADGTLWGAGGNSNGQLGIGTTSSRESSWKQLLTGVSQISAGNGFSLAMKANGTVWGTGLNTNNQYGITTNNLIWNQVLTDALKISAGNMHAIAIKNDGTIWATGYNAYGQLGDGTTTKSNGWKQTYPNAIMIATDAVLKAEGSLLQLDVDSARILVNNLPTGNDKTALTNRLNAVQAIIDITNAVPANLRSVSVTSTTANLAWDAPAYNVVGYKIYRDGLEVGSSTTTTYTDSELIPGTTYLYIVKSYDTTGHLSNSSVQLSVTSEELDTEAPEAPGNLIVMGVTETTVDLMWDNATDNVGIAGYKIYRNGEEVGQSSTTDFSDAGLTAGTTYSYMVKAFDVAGNLSNSSNEITVSTSETPDTEAPMAPANLIFLGSTEATVDLMWDNATDNVGIAGYKIYRNGIEVGTTSTTDYSDTGLMAGTNYSYMVKAFDAAGNISESSNEVLATTSGQSDTEAPTTPENLICLGVGSTTADLMWDNSADNVSVAGYKIYRNGVEIGSTTTTDYADTELSPGTSYTYTIRAFDSSGNLSEYSIELGVTTEN